MKLGNRGSGGIHIECHSAMCLSTGPPTKSALSDHLSICLSLVYSDCKQLPKVSDRGAFQVEGPSTEPQITGLQPITSSSPAVLLNRKQKLERFFSMADPPLCNCCPREIRKSLSLRTFCKWLNMVYYMI